MLIDKDHPLIRQHAELVRRNRDLEEDPVITFQAEHTMVRIERMLMNGPTKDCVTCGEEIPEGRRKACPEVIWCVDCARAYEEERGKFWTKKPGYIRTT